MRLVFLYVQSRHGKYFADRVQEEGYFYLIRRMVETGVVDEATIIIESPQQGAFEYQPGLSCRIVRDINTIEELLEPGDVIWCRGGWKGWHNMLKRAGAKGHWLMIYAANTGREKWPFWDIVLDDLGGRDYQDPEGRVSLDFRKPINEELFRPMNEIVLYDLCIGASHVHDRKGQWRAIEVMIAYKEMFGKDLKAIIPGGIRRGAKTAAMMEFIEEYGLNVKMPGTVSRQYLCKIYNRSRIFVHLGSHGQGDRGPMEAMRCGCHLIIGFPKYHAPWVHESMICYVPEDPDNYEDVAQYIHDVMPVYFARKNAVGYFISQASIENVCLPAMKKLFDYLRAHPEPDREALAKEVAIW